MYLRANENMMKPSVKIHIGQYYASREPMVIGTILGSCVSVCLFDPQTRVGGMNHILRVGEDTTVYDGDARYGINAMEVLINEMVGLGAVRSRFVAKVFGGGNILSMSEEYRPGPKNVEFVLRFLEVENIKLQSQSTGGPYSRKLFLHTDTFECLLKKNCSSVSSSVANAEKAHHLRVKSIPNKSGDITLF